jgi:hypothetical protein
MLMGRTVFWGRNGPTYDAICALPDPADLLIIAYRVFYWQYIHVIVRPCVAESIISLLETLSFASFWAPAQSSSPGSYMPQG